MDGILRCCHGEEGAWFGNLRIASLLFVDDVVLLASSGHDLQFTAECEAVGMKVSSSRSQAMDLNWKKVECSLWVVLYKRTRLQAL